MTPDVTTPKPREAWIDIAKGIAILLVVFYHSVMYLDVAGVSGALTPLNSLLDTFRMPLFFFMSGVLGTSALRLTYRSLFRKRLVLLLYLYVVWVIAQQLFLLALPRIDVDGHATSWTSLVTFFLRPSENLWFIYALPLFFTVAWLVRSWNPALSVAAAAMLSVAFSTGLLDTDTAWDKMGRYFVFFLAALWLGPAVRRIVPKLRWWHAALLVITYVGATAVMVKLELTHTPFVALAVSALAVAVGIAVSSVLAHSDIAAPIRFLGSRTLPIYLVHAFPMIAIAAVIASTDATIPGWAATLLPLVMTVVAVALALVLYRWLGRVPGIFTVPVAAWTTPTVPVEPQRQRQP